MSLISKVILLNSDKKEAEENSDGQWCVIVPECMPTGVYCHVNRIISTNAKWKMCIC